MSSLDGNAEMLVDFGLTRNQAKVYMAIARMRLAPIGPISKASKVRREDVYRILPKLEKMGLIERVLGKPTKIRATPVDEALSILVKHEEDAARKRLSTLKDKTEEFLKHLARAPRLEVEEKANFALHSKRESMMAKMLTMIKNAERELDVVFSTGQVAQFIHAFGEQLKKAMEKGVRIRLVSAVPEYVDTLPKAIGERMLVGDSIELKYSDLPSSHYVIVDLKEALISTATGGNMGENPCLWSNSKGLVGVFQGDFENLWHNAVSLENIETIAVPEKVAGFMEQLRPTNHLIFIYDSSEAKHNVLFNYLKVGLDKGEAGAYVTTDETPHQIEEAMKKFGIDVEEHKRTGALRILGYEEVYITDGRFNIATTMNLWNKLYNEALKHGFKGLRVTGEMGCFFKHNLTRELLEYEKALHRVLDLPIIAICAYNIETLNRSRDPINLYSELARAHSTVLFTGIDNKLGRMEIRTV